MKEIELYEVIYNEMEKRITPSNVENMYWYDKQIAFTKIEGKTLLESFMSQHKKLAQEKFDELFDEIHPY